MFSTDLILHRAQDQIANSELRGLIKITFTGSHTYHCYHQEKI